MKDSVSCSDLLCSGSSFVAVGCDVEVTQDAEGVSKAEMELKDEYKALVKLQHEISEEVKFTMVLFSSLHAPFSLFLCAPSPTPLN
jgi:hypothetical protein